MVSQKFQCAAVCPISQGLPRNNMLVPLPGGRYVVADEDGYSWEVKPEWEAVMGALHVKVHAHDIVVDNEAGIWSAWQQRIGVHASDNLDRFTRSRQGGASGELQFEMAQEIQCLAARADGGVWYSTGQTFGQVKVVHQLLEVDSQCWIVTVSGKLYVWQGNECTQIMLPGKVLALDHEGGEVIVATFHHQ